MRSDRFPALATFTFCAFALFAASATAQDFAGRKEMKRADLSGAPGMEVVSSITEYKVGDTAPKHFHNGIETAYVIQGAMIQLPGKEPTMMETGTVILNLRDIVHGGFTVVGDKPLKLFTAHIVDKGKPLYAAPKVEAK
ncbi:MAG: cupin domain-containing protein [Betaproteobacteria bacterium]